MSQIPPEKRFSVLKRDSFKCHYCGKSSDDGAILHVDHITPVCKGGTNEPDNLITACADCNHGKGPHPGRNGNGQSKPNPAKPKFKKLSDVAGLVNRFFHSRKNGKIEWQGKVLCQVSDTIYLVQLLEWFGGEPTKQVLVDLSDMTDWSFYSTGYDMRFAYAQESRMPMADFERQEEGIRIQLEHMKNQ